MFQNMAREGTGKLTLLIYMDGLTSVLTTNRTVVNVDSLSFGTINSQDDEIQSVLDQFYDDTKVDKLHVNRVELVFVNAIFHKTGKGNLECYKNRLPAFLLYHQEFFSVPVTHNHIALMMGNHMAEWQTSHGQSALWFHLRKNHLYVSFGTNSGEYSITSFEVRKTLDVYYYILFNIQTLNSTLTDLESIAISGELLDMDKIHNFFTKNVPEKKLITFWQWKGLLGRPQPEISPLLPEVNI